MDGRRSLTLGGGISTRTGGRSSPQRRSEASDLTGSTRSPCSGAVLHGLYANASILIYMDQAGGAHPPVVKVAFTLKCSSFSAEMQVQRLKPKVVCVFFCFFLPASYKCTCVRFFYAVYRKPWEKKKANLQAVDLCASSSSGFQGWWNVCLVRSRHHTDHVGEEMRRCRGRRGGGTWKKTAGWMSLVTWRRWKRGGWWCAGVDVTLSHTLCSSCLTSNWSTT